MLLDVYWPGRTDELLKSFLDKSPVFTTGLIKQLCEKGPGDECDSGLCCDRPTLPSEVLSSFGKADISETEDHIVLKCDIPGIKKDEIILVLEGSSLKISGERKEERTARSITERYVGRFQRVFRVPQGTKKEELEAQYVDGVLTVWIPKKAPVPTSDGLIKIK